MTGKLDKFYIEHDINGARIMTHSHQLTSACKADGEINTIVQLLKDDLDACASEMKRIIKAEGSSPFDQGWKNT